MVRTFLNKLSIIIPLSFIYVLLTSSISISITEINLYCSCFTVLFIYITFAFVWLCCSPFRGACCNGSWTELLFNLVPAEFFLLFVFAQWHFAAAVIVFAVSAVANFICYYHLRVDEYESRRTAKQHLTYDNAIKRCALLITAVCFFIPCNMAFFVYNIESPVYTADEDTLTRLLSETEVPNTTQDDEDPYQNNTALLECFSDDKWEKYNLDERVAVLQGLADFETERLGIPAVPVTVELLGYLTAGEYSNETNEVWVDVDYLSYADSSDCINTVCHEVYHSYENHLVSEMDWTKAVMQNSYFDELRSWKANFEDYHTFEADGMEAYEVQPIETAARAYAEEETERILSYIR